MKHPGLSDPGPLRLSGLPIFWAFALLGPSSILGIFLGRFIPHYFIVQPDPLQESPTGSQAGLAARVQILQRFR